MAPTDARALLAAGVSLGLIVAACAPAPVRLPTATPAGTVSPVATPTSTPRPEARLVGVPVTRPTQAVATAQVRVRPPTPGPERTLVEVATPPTPETHVAITEVPVLDGLLDGLVPDGDPAYGLVLEDVGSGARTAINDAQAFPSASLYKLGVAWLALREVDAGTLSLDDPLPIEDEDTVEPEPRGGFKAGDAPTVHEALDAMLSVSSNAAAHAFLRVLGRDRLNQEMERIGLTQMRVPPDDDDGEAVTSAADIGRLLRLVSTSPELSAGSKEVLAQGMANVAPPDALRDTLPDSVSILDKTGNLPDSSNVGALLETSRGIVIVVVVDSGVTPGEARAVIAELGQIAYHSLLE